MTIDQAIKNIHQNLKAIYDENEILSFRNIIFEQILNINKTEYFTSKDKKLSPQQIALVDNTIEQLKEFKPIQYIVGQTEFYNLSFKLTPAVLIPRPETEELVDLILKNEDLENKNVLDIGTGSGCIAISIAKNAKCKMFAIDISKDALTIAKQNATNNNANVTFLQKDIKETNPIEIDGKTVFFDLIVSNPPYVRESEKSLMKKNVLDYEPHTALFVDDDNAIIFYEKIAEFAQKFLNKNGTIYVEINENLWYETIESFKKFNFNDFNLRKDIFGKRRFLRIKK